MIPTTHSLQLLAIHFELSSFEFNNYKINLAINNSFDANNPNVIEGLVNNYVPHNTVNSKKLDFNVFITFIYNNGVI